MARTAAIEAFERLDGLSKNYPKVWKAYGPISEDIVAAAQARLGLPFPNSYSLFLMQHGFANFWGCCVNGIDPDSTPTNLFGPLFLDTEKMWAEGWIPRDCLYIEDRDESDILLDTSQMKDGEAPIIEVEVGTMPEEVDRTPVSPSFAEYYLARLTEMIEYLKEKGELESRR